jgi:hypothetical protein
MDEELKSRFEQVLQHYSDVIKERDDALLREKKAREQFEASFRTAVDNVIFPAAAAQVKQLVGADEPGLPRHQIRQWPFRQKSRSTKAT